MANAPVARPAMDSSSDAEIVQATTAVPAKTTANHAGSAAPDAFSVLPVPAAAAAALLKQATIHAPLPLPAHPVRLAPRQLPPLAPRPPGLANVLAANALAAPDPKQLSLSRGAKAEHTKRSAATRELQPSPTINIDLTASDVGATDGSAAVAGAHAAACDTTTHAQIDAPTLLRAQRACSAANAHALGAFVIVAIYVFFAAVRSALVLVYA